ncbi:MAG: tRNA (adenosine(37)-N6)-threonylcarbamoyltransferase complex dimerization subunit type 1 TsaB [Candidatus Paracaedimonas acanthamoebae]|uniref:tRNA (Adenosine(37)-N6)-threonylcarbamoyltransferase complex dimerization subunit type 1 TsaB n=1 Tax=Candidatus Paracaedimonas acanthamoebae TaxID=244581 RepID=A0A8J7PJH0_9PROT|nr:tRNA (adenosine(37)-N6)-threonylcarbamoyltransferase complex dimerization subunit type 1 TsaB [Candidatus Paracaedimonas acanthamoebae]
MNILAFESANFSLSIAVQNCDNQRAFREVREVRGQDTKALPLIIEALQEVNLKFEDIDLISTTLGPGSFTGLRVGLSLARGFRLALGIPLVTFNSFDWVFETVKEKQKYEEIYVILNSQREELFFKKYAITNQDPELLTGQEIANLITSKPTLIIGDGAIFVQDLVVDRQNVEVITSMPTAETLLEIAAKNLKARYYSDEKPFYLRSPDITQPKK